MHKSRPEARSEKEKRRICIGLTKEPSKREIWTTYRLSKMLNKDTSVPKSTSYDSAKSKMAIQIQFLDMESRTVELESLE